MFLFEITAFITGLVIGGIGGFWFTKKHFEDTMQKNPPVNEKMIRAMFNQMGRKASEAQIKAVMKSMDKYK